MNNNAFKNIASEFLNSNSAIKNKLNSQDAIILANKLNQMSNTNPMLQNIVNSAKMGDINSAKNSLQNMLNTKEGQDIANAISKIIGG